MRVSVIIANRNDTAMLGVTLRSALEELSAVPGGGQVVIVDNSEPNIQAVISDIVPARYFKSGQVKLLYQDFPCLFTARESAAMAADGEYILCVDSHMIFGHNSILSAVHFMNRHRKEKIGFGHLPINWLCQHEGASRHDMKELHGTWGKKYDFERPISWKGMPWICRRDWFLNTLNGYGAFSKHRLSWGGGDMYLGLKSWMIGHENWAIPSRPVIHIGPLPKRIRDFYTYRLYGKSGDTNNYIGWISALLSMGGEEYVKSSLFKEFMKNRFDINVDENIDYARQFTEEAWFKQNAVMSFDDLIKKPWEDFFSGVYSGLSQKVNLSKAIKREDWIVIDSMIKEKGVARVLEFGAGLSSVLLRKSGLEVITVETDEKYMEKIKAFCNGDYRNSAPEGRFDFVLVDGTSPRKWQMEIAKKVAPVVMVHDGYTPPDRKAANDVFSDWEEIKVNSKRARVFCEVT